MSIDPAKLRELANEHDDDPGFTAVYLRKAADEIERLRAREAKWRELVELFREEASGIYGLAYAHGWRGGPPDRVEHAAKLRRELGVE